MHLRPERFDPIHERLKQLGLTSLTHMRPTQRADVPNTVNPLSHQSSNAGHLMKRELRELVAESRTRTLVITVRQAIHASDAGQVGNGLKVPSLPFVAFTQYVSSVCQFAPLDAKGKQLIENSKRLLIEHGFFKPEEFNGVQIG